MPTKAELIKENEVLKDALKGYETKVQKALINILNETCADSHEYIEDFCKQTGFEYPTQVVTIRIPYGATMWTISDDEGNSIDFEEIVP